MALSGFCVLGNKYVICFPLNSWKFSYVRTCMLWDICDETRSILDFLEG